MTTKLVYTLKEGSVYVSGKTYDCKETLKLLGGKWRPEEKAWLFAERSLDDVKESIEETYGHYLEAIKKLQAQVDIEAKKKKLWEASPQGKKERVLEALKKPTFWICCEECNVLDWKKMWTECVHHPNEDGTIFRVKGQQYCGT